MLHDSRFFLRGEWSSQLSLPFEQVHEDQFSVSNVILSWTFSTHESLSLVPKMLVAQCTCVPGTATVLYSRLGPCLNF